ncbi:hypothetical protein K439DRAFT_1624078 [Ramaria rubella]|nr:hypothetical protein K439DRAFT_1624078 [Ramaria rubella]
MATSDTESLDSTMGLSPLEVKSIEHVYKSSDAPMSKKFIDQYDVTGKDCIGANKWFTTSNNRPFRIRFPAHINSLYKDLEICHGHVLDIFQASQLLVTPVEKSGTLLTY